VQREMKTLSVRPTNAGDNRYFIVFEHPRTGKKLVDSRTFNQLTEAQKAMVVVSK
jgi:hypothetical protein